ncbi:hypothetical protein Drorol1_Dr00020967 [Drosera rotundifolia]
MKLHLLLLYLVLCVASASSILALCHDAERSALQHFKQGFSIHPSASIDAFAYPKTRYWKSSHNVTNDCCEWDGVECDEHIGHVIGLDLSSSLLYGSILPNSPLFELVHLQALNLSDNNLRYSPIPSQLGRLLNLKYLNLSRSRVSGQVPIELSTLSKLISLDLSLNIEPSSGAQLLQIQNPSLSMLVKNLTTLEILILSEVNISSPVPQTFTNLTSLKILLLRNCNLNGLFPEGIIQLPELQILNLAFNTNLSGYVPEIPESSKLKKLFLDSTSFSGQLPLSIGNASFLEILSLSSCNLEGSIPISFGELTRLTSLDLSHNNFTGIIPRMIKNLTLLSTLSLSDNYLRGNISPLANLTKLISLDLSYNYFTGSIREFISELENLESLYLDENNFNGPVEFDIFFTSKNLQALSLSNIDLIVSTTTHNNSYYPQFVYLDFTTCNMVRFPNFIQNQTRLSHLLLRNDSIRGPLPVPPPSLVVFDIQANALEGEIPRNICNATTLKILAVGKNRLGGKIPPCLFNLSNNNLACLDLGHNSLHGTIPDAFTSSCTMKWFQLGENQVEGALPRSLASCSSLEVVALDHNNIVDTFSIWLSGLSELRVIDLSSNKLHGPLLLEDGLGFRKLYFLTLSHNHFTGSMPDDFFTNLYSMEGPSPQQVIIVVPCHVIDVEIMGTYYLGVFREFNKKHGLLVGSDFIPIAIDLSHNKLVGKVPDSIGNLHTLQTLDLSYNNLTGAIPTSFEKLSNVNWLDLFHNSLSGEIPQQLTQLSLLNHFNVSYNQLTGPIPQGGQLTTFENDSFIGNPGLCGSPLSKKCGNHEVLAPPHDSSVEEDEGSADVIGWVIRCMGYISGLVVGLVLGRMITDENHDWFVETFGRRQQHKKKKKNR